MNAISKMFYRCHQNKLNKEGKVKPIPEDLYEYFFKNKDENMLFVCYENENVYLVNATNVFELTEGMLSDDDFEKLVETLFANKETKFSKESDLIMRIYSAEHNVDDHLFEYIENGDISLQFQILYLYLINNCFGALEILMKAGLWWLVIGAINGDILLANTSGSPKEILAAPITMLRYFNSNDGNTFFGKKTEEEIKHAFNIKNKYKLGNTFNIKEYETGCILEKNSHHLNHREMVYAIVEHVKAKKLQELIDKKNAVRDVLGLNLLINDSNLETAYDLILKIPEVDSMIEQRELSEFFYYESGFKIKAPTALELYSAAFELKNCLLSYSLMYALGQVTILLLYHKEKIIGALEINVKDMTVVQSYLACNEPICENTEEGKFLARYMAEKGLKRLPVIECD